jgi:hypothetical protein
MLVYAICVESGWLNFKNSNLLSNPWYQFFRFFDRLLFVIFILFDFDMLDQVE